MPFFPTVAAAAAPQDPERAGLARRLRKLERVFQLGDIQREALGAAQVVEYYERCHDAFRRYHSAEGACHMALNDGDRFDPDGFYGQPRLMERGWAVPPAAVLELAFGQGFNLAWLAQRHPGTHFTGIDLTPAHLGITAERVRRAGLGNVTLTQGDFHRLPYAAASFDQVFCVEAFCYARDLPGALAEVARVLRPGGEFTLFDGYLVRSRASLSADEALAVELVAKGMAFDAFQVAEELVGIARGAGLQCTTLAALDEQVMPSLRRLERVTGAVIRFPWLGRRALARRSPMRGRNVLAGYLMRSATALGLIGYRHIVLRKEA